MGTFTVAGTWALVELLDKAMVTPPGDAALVNVTVPNVEVPPIRVFGLMLTEATWAARTVRLSDIPPPFPDTAITVDESLVTVLVVTANEAELVPAGIEIELGACAMAGLLLEIETANPLAGAVPVKLTVTIDTPPPRTVVGDNVILPSTAGWIISVTVLDTAPDLAAMTEVVFAETDWVPTRKLVEVLPPGMVTDAGTEALLLEDFKDTAKPPVGAAPLKLTEPTATSPSEIVGGSKATERSVGA